jgi:hypothetical protein
MYRGRREQRAVGADAGAADVRLANRAAGWHGRVYQVAKQLKQTTVLFFRRAAAAAAKVGQAAFATWVSRAGEG